jgi:lipid-binding SYLF domain-containing protein
MQIPTTALFLHIVYVIALLCPWTASADSAHEMQRSARRALANLYTATPAAKALGEKAAGVLVFPEIVKGGFVVAAQYGNGVLFKGGKVAGYYNTTSGSFGFQAGIQTFGYALFFMTKDDLNYLERSAGWEIGVGPSITVVDVGIARSLSTTTARKGMYAFFFDQKGLMGGLGLQGTKITRIHPK